jgi:hypothetical protein
MGGHSAPASRDLFLELFAARLARIGKRKGTKQQAVGNSKKIFPVA